MTRRWHVWLGTVAVVTGLGLSAAVVLSGPGANAPPVAPAPAAASNSGAAAATSSPVPSATRATTQQRRPPPVGPAIPPASAEPPAGTVHIGARYLRRYDAERVSWDELLDQGRRLPDVSSGCTTSWRQSGKDGRLDWSSARFRCLNSLPGQAFVPQGVGGSATARGYRINGRPAAARNLLVTSWYSRAQESGLLAANRAGQSATRMVVMDVDRRRYNTVELVRPVGSGRFAPLNSHGSGLVWAGQYLYSSSRSFLWMYNADDLLRIGHRFVLPAVAHWKVSGSGGLSSICLDTSTTPAQLVGINYSRSGQSFVQTFELDADGLLSKTSRSVNADLMLTNSYGDQGRVVHSVTSVALPGRSYQGVASVGRFRFANSSARDEVVVIRGGTVVDTFRLPAGNPESIYLDYERQTFVSLTEHGSQFLFELPLAELTRAVRR